MKPRKLHIIYYVLKFRLSRTCHPNKVGWLTQLKWKRNLRKSPFYNAIVSKGLRFPVIDKKIFMAKFDRINTKGIKKDEAFEIALKAEESRDFASTMNGVSVGLSSGTSGNRGMFLTSRKEQEKWVGAILERVIGLSFKKRRVAFFLRANNNLYEAVKSKLIQFDFYDLQQNLNNLIVDFIKSNSNIIVAQPSVLLEIARHCDKHTISIKFDKVISVAEVLEEDIKTYVESVFKSPISQVYQCTEGFLAYTCKLGSMHLNEDFLKIDRHYLDTEHTKFHPIITDYLRYTQPVIMYELNDILHIGEQCRCGSQAAAISKIEGRSDDVFRFTKEGEEYIIFPDFIRRAIILSQDTITNYIVSQKSNDEVTLSIEGNHKSLLEEGSIALRKLLDKKKLPHVTVSVTDFEHNPILKFKRIRNDYSK